MLKKFMTIVMAMVCVFSLCLFGCGDDVPEVFAGNYEEMDNAKIESVLSDISEKKDAKKEIDFTKGIELSMSMEMNGSGAGEKMNGKLDYSLKTKVVDNDLVMSGKIFTDLGETLGTGNIDMELYYADGVVYSIVKGEKVKAEASLKSVLDDFNLDDMTMGNDYDFKTILEQVKMLNNKDALKAKMPELDLGLDIDYDYDVSKAKASIDTSNNQTKLKVELEFAIDMNMSGVVSKTETEAVYYYLFDKDYNLAGMYIDGTIKTEATTDGESGKMEVKMHISAVPFDGEIKAPSDLDTYK